ncbi:hypothetical protein K437DRAFT_125819 [Tilletiaria anomala UBC 951]|uniref:BSD domain-containing protein n=1 Tax=Tilletiaria anomala (strain ATCC 24038 / CBS 436.72 / UBC 951) TaxID=1037660 RepID=A0A066VUA9_TILAU|nr:uncharacterized protein K437DRAFT_125819 [Tilletiaria anomala UBC 951]KDN45086.1 hypothetical protein K437DRAFT_125819 [Tilletiaria anomala UBC 951]
MDADIVSQGAAAQCTSEQSDATKGGGVYATATGASSSSSADAGTSEATTDLVAGLSSWWGGISKISAEKFETARANIQTQSKELVRVAKDELQRFEQSLEEAQKRARKESKSGAISVTSATQGDTGDKSKGKGKARQVDGDAVDGDKEKGSQRERSGIARGEEGIEQGGGDNVAMVDANGDIVGGSDPSRGPGSPATTTFDFDIEQRLVHASALFSNLAKSLQNDPRVQSIQRSLVGISSDASQQQGQQVSIDGAEKEGSTLAESTPISNLSSTIQSSLPHLSWAQSQALAEKYWSKSEEFAKEVIKEVKDIAGEFVQVLPPEKQVSDEKAAGKQQEGKRQKSQKSKADDIVFDADKDGGLEDISGALERAAAPTPLKPETSKSKADFDWDAPENGKSDSAFGLQTSTGPPTGSWGDSDDEVPARAVSAAPGRTASEVVTAKAGVGKDASSGGEAAESQSKAKEATKHDDEDSDWE